MSEMAGRWNGWHREVDKGFHENVIAHLSLQPVSLIASFFYTFFFFFLLPLLFCHNRLCVGLLRRQGRIEIN